MTKISLICTRCPPVWHTQKGQLHWGSKGKQPPTWATYSFGVKEGVPGAKRPEIAKECACPGMALGQQPWPLGSAWLTSSILVQKISLEGERQRTTEGLLLSSFLASRRSWV